MEKVRGFLRVLRSGFSYFDEYGTLQELWAR